MIPEHTARGVLPVGIHVATWVEVAERFGGTIHREALLVGLVSALRFLAAAGCSRAWLGGSFVSSKPGPGDVDVVYDVAGVDPMSLPDVFFEFDNDRAAQKARFGGEFFPSHFREAMSGRMFREFFAHDRQGREVGIVEVDLSTLP